MQKKEVSIIIVAFHAKEQLQKCLKSIPSDPQIEIIVIDNSNNNRGFGRACNEGAQQATGTYLFFLNPDTILCKDTVTLLLNKIKSDPTIGIISPQFLDGRNNPYGSYSKQPTFFTSVIRFSFLYTFLPKSLQKIVHPYDFDTYTKSKYVEAVSGAALFMEKDLFFNIGGFDSDYFMYWEDYDICQKVLQTGKKILFFSAAQIKHSGGGTSSDKKQTKKYFNESRKIFFYKRFGKIRGFLLTAFLELTEMI